MRKALIALVTIALVTAGSLAPEPAEACVADPVLTTVVVVSAPIVACQWVFQPGPPMRDALVFDVNLRDPANAPLPGCPVTAVYVPLTGTATACPLVASQTRMTDPAGRAQFVFEDLRGCGTFRIDVFDISGALVGVAGPFNNTSSDLTGDGMVDVFDLGIFASGLPPGFNPCADYNCDGIVDVFDLGIWAGGLGGLC